MTLSSLATKARVWVIADEATNFDTRFGVPWPEEREDDDFHFILTGSMGIATFVHKRHLEKCVWDLPLLSATASANFACKLAVELDLDLVKLYEIFNVKLAPADTRNERLGERLVETFGGVPLHC